MSISWKKEKGNQSILFTRLLRFQFIILTIYDNKEKIVQSKNSFRMISNWQCSCHSFWNKHVKQFREKFQTMCTTRNVWHDVPVINNQRREHTYKKTFSLPNESTDLKNGKDDCEQITFNLQINQIVKNRARWRVLAAMPCLVLSYRSEDLPSLSRGVLTVSPFLRHNRSAVNESF